MKKYYVNFSLFLYIFSLKKEKKKSNFDSNSDNWRNQITNLLYLNLNVHRFSTKKTNKKNFNYIDIVLTKKNLKSFEKINQIEKILMQ